MPREREMSNKRIGYIPGVIVFAALLLFLISLLWLSGNAILISPDYRYYFEFDDVVGLRDQAPVYLRGYRVGWTKAVEFKESVVRVTVDIKKKYRFPEDSQVEITTLNFIGEQAITIRPGKSTLALEIGATLRGQNNDLMTLAAKILNSTQEKLNEVQLGQVIEKVSSSMDGVLDAVGQMKLRIEKLDVSMYNQQLRRLGEASEEVKNFMATAQQDTRRISQAGQESLEKFQKTLEQVDETLQSLNQLSAEAKYMAQRLNRGEGTAGQLLQNQAFFDTLNHTLEELNLFLADIKKNPKKYVKFSIF